MKSVFLPSLFTADRLDGPEEWLFRSLLPEFERAADEGDAERAAMLWGVLWACDHLGLQRQDDDSSAAAAKAAFEAHARDFALRQRAAAAAAAKRIELPVTVSELRVLYDERKRRNPRMSKTRICSLVARDLRARHGITVSASTVARRLGIKREGKTTQPLGLAHRAPYRVAMDTPTPPAAPDQPSSDHETPLTFDKACAYLRELGYDVVDSDVDSDCGWLDDPTDPVAAATRDAFAADVERREA